MPKTHSDYPINLTFRVSVAQRDYLEEVASLHGITPSDLLRAMLDTALTARAKADLGVPDADDATALTHARQFKAELEKEAAHA